MATLRTRPDRQVGELVDELRTMVTDYVRQETIEPAKHLGATFGYSLAAGILLGFGFVLTLFGLLRYLQSKVWIFPQGAWTWLPYLITALAGLIVIGVSLKLAKGRSNGSSAD
ncbi:MAG: phage holin family protein [Acidimicrobiia bacterium]